MVHGSRLISQALPWATTLTQSYLWPEPSALVSIHKPLFALQSAADAFLMGCMRSLCQGIVEGRYWL